MVIKGIGAMMAGGNGQRIEDDFYPTPPEATLAIVDRLTGWPKQVWEPACGNGAMARALEFCGLEVVGSDLIDRGYGRVADFLTCAPPEGWSGAIITNPPFYLAAKFIHRAHYIGATHMALLLKATFWNAAKRLATWDCWSPYARLPLTFRPDFKGLGAPTMDLEWVLWDRTTPPLPRPLAKPPEVVVKRLNDRELFA